MMHKSLQALGRLPVGVMNKSEKEFSEYLESLRISGQIQAWKFEPEKFRLANNCYYTPDFFCLNADGTVTFYEVKGYWADDAKIKMKVVAEQFPWYSFVAVYKQTKKAGGGWKFEQF